MKIQNEKTERKREKIDHFWYSNWLLSKSSPRDLVDSPGKKYIRFDIQ